MAKYDLQESSYDVGDTRFAIVASRFNAAIVEKLTQGAGEALRRQGIDDAAITIVRVPGAFEIPLMAQHLAASGSYGAIIAVGAVIRGGTPHFEFVAGECARGLSKVALKHGIPVSFGVLTVDTMDQALARAGGKEGNKGEEAAMAALEMVSLLRHPVR